MCGNVRYSVEGEPAGKVIQLAISMSVSADPIGTLPLRGLPKDHRLDLLYERDLSQ